LKDLGDPPVEPALSILVNSLEHQADLHPLGRFLMRIHLLELLETRLRLVGLWTRRSEALAVSPVQRPIFITGMPRSGSTFLHELLAEGIQRIMRFRDDHPELATRFIDVMYRELVSDPSAIVRQIYQHFDIGLTEAAVERMQRMASNRSRYRGITASRHWQN
jgi:Sulfotransferase family